MKTNVYKLYQIAQKTEKIILGLMSGTSLDGLDLALCKVSNSGFSTTVNLINFTTHNYNEDFKAELKTIFGKEQISLEKLCLLNAYIGKYHSQIINETLSNWGIKNEDVDLIASHGQTVYHSPKTKHQSKKFGNATLQIGDADHIAFNTNIITVSDFRQKHIAAGGQGAPLAIYGDCFLLSSKMENRVLLNIGGIANFTYLPQNKNTNEIICTDTGPGNTLMDVYVHSHFSNKFYDDNASIALKGNVNQDLLQALLQHPFFNQQFPKTTGQEIFNLSCIEKAQLASKTTQLNIHDILATLNYFTAVTIANGIKQTVKNNDFIIYVSGGGANNPLLMQNLQQLLPNNKVLSIDVLGINANAKEAILFAMLANECVCGEEEFYKTLGKNILPITMGKISFPV
ncbi:MAG: anhydro-N-acetylmuramic acid kinase [Chitinophagaceae bacterium]